MRDTALIRFNSPGSEESTYDISETLAKTHSCDHEVHRRNVVPKGEETFEIVKHWRRTFMNKQEGIRLEWMGNVEKITEQDPNLRLLLTKNQRHRGDTINNGTVTTTITSPADDIIGVKYVHWAGQYDKGPHFELQTLKSSPTISRKEESVEYKSGNLQLCVNTIKNSFGAAFSGKNGKKFTSHSFRSVGYITDETKSPYEDGLYRERKGYMFAALDLGVGEKLYGLGERFGSFIKNGQCVEMWNEDGGTSSELAYKNIPFYLSSKGYGVFVNHPGKVSFELQSERTTRVNISVMGESLEYFIIYGPSPKDIIIKYTALTGRPAVPPAWSYNLWLSTSFTTNYDEKTVTSFLDGFKDRDIPLGTFHFDPFWMKAYQWCDFEFDADIFPDAGGYLQRLQKRGLKVCVWINPYIGQESPLFEQGKEHGYFVKRLNGDVWQWDNWLAGMALVDFTNPEACKWYQGYLSKLVKLGVSAFKTDFGERIPWKNVLYFNGSDPLRMHNYYTYLYNKTVHEVIINDLGPTNGCLFARSATTGSQQFPVHWGGDCESTFEAMAETLRGGLSLACSGFGYWAHDIGGFEGTPSPILYQRWCQFGLLSSHSRLHGSGSFRVPWLFGEDSCHVLRKFVKLKLSLLPYLLPQALEAHEKGIPVMRPTFMEFPKDDNTWGVDTQYFLGNNLLVAPVFSEEGEVKFYVPESEGEWVYWFDHSKRYRGGKWYHETYGFDTLPVLIRPGTVTAINTAAFDLECTYSKDSLELLVNGMDMPFDVKLVSPKAPDKVEETVSVTAGETNFNIIDLTK
ncbi:MAG: hypothetical protein M1834_002235 [Cirrosporium novae-zelandiae]|nr:MAG: hypothetical protein M1834_002235 [Cirrosporium novae-zelandiae]